MVVAHILLSILKTFSRVAFTDLKDVCQQISVTLLKFLIKLEVESGSPVIDGRVLQVSLAMKNVQVFGSAHLWDKHSVNIASCELAMEERVVKILATCS